MIWYYIDNFLHGIVVKNDWMWIYNFKVVHWICDKSDQWIVGDIDE